MLYQLRLGQSERQIAKQSHRFDKKIPDEIQNAPALRFELEFYWDSFWELIDERDNSFDIGMIKRQTIVDYANEYNLPIEQKDDLIFYIKRMDNAFVKYQKDHQNKT